MFDEGFTRVEVRTERSTRTIVIPLDFDLLVNTESVVPSLVPLCSSTENMTLRTFKDANLSLGISGMALRTLILEIKNARREEKRKVVSKKMVLKFREYRAKYREICIRFCTYDNFQSLRDELRQKDDELVRVIGKCSELEGALRAKEDELEVSRGVRAECDDLQSQVASQRAELEQSSTRADDLSDELIGKTAELGKDEEARMTALARVATSEEVIRVLKFERASEAEAAVLREASLEERVGELEGEVSNLNDQVAALEAEKTQLLARPSFSHTSTYPDVAGDSYEKWIDVKAQLDIFRDLMAAGRVTEVEFEGARDKART
ncbi:uncharacterized protein [Nicotiana sylvestris]|uniref:Uncharacterized protein LOC104216240 n=1 Tax=Nicotiana sylvestris TaxID=4096 RepID=A0A1U7VQD5_NICSY|nr:PREDICTED: uncharacterized protein LOC104216240 [Nicotiana sylvestris]